MYFKAKLSRGIVQCAKNLDGKCTLCTITSASAKYSNREDTHFSHLLSFYILSYRRIVTCVCGYVKTRWTCSLGARILVRLLTRACAVVSTCLACVVFLLSQRFLRCVVDFISIEDNCFTDVSFTNTVHRNSERNVLRDTCDSLSLWSRVRHFSLNSFENMEKK